MRNATLRLRAIDLTDLAGLVGDVDRALNRPGEPLVTVVAAGDVLAFECPTWGPILKSRVHDALDELLGSGWRDAFVQDGDTRWVS